MQKPLTNPSINAYESLKRNRVVRVLETVQDLFVISLCMALFALMAIQLREMFFEMLPPLNFPGVTSDILFLLILVELFRLLIIYLQEQRVSIGVAVEVAIVSVLREVIVRGVLETSWVQILATCAFLLVMATLLVVRVWLPPTFSGIDPEKRLAMRQKFLNNEALSNPIETLPNLDPHDITSIFAGGMNGLGHDD